MGQGCGRQLTSVEAVSVLVASVSRKKYAFLRTERDESAYRGGGSGGRPGSPGPAGRPARPYRRARPCVTCTCYLYHGPCNGPSKGTVLCSFSYTCDVCCDWCTRPLEASPSSKSTIADGVQRRRRLRRAVPLFPVLTLGRAKAARRRLLHRRQKFVLRIQGEHVLARV